MKKFLSLICALCIAHCSFSQGMMDIYGTSYQVDTIEYKQVGPGAMYCYAKLPAFPQDIHILTIDLENRKRIDFILYSLVIFIYFECSYHLIDFVLI